MGNSRRVQFFAPKIEWWKCAFNHSQIYLFKHFPPYIFSLNHLLTCSLVHLFTHISCRVQFFAPKIEWWKCAFNHSQIYLFKHFPPYIFSLNHLLTCSPILAVRCNSLHQLFNGGNVRSIIFKFTFLSIFHPTFNHLLTCSPVHVFINLAKSSFLYIIQKLW